MTPLFRASGICKHYPIGHGLRRSSLHAVDDASFEIGDSECVGLVGESGCGKSTLSRIVARLIEPTSGTLEFSGVEIGAISLRRFAAAPERKAIQAVFQDPKESLNPSMTAFQSIADPIERLGAHHSRHELVDIVRQAAADVGISSDLLYRYPHQLSGGQAARVGIARAIVLKPKLLVLDEPTSALDVSVQSTILHLLADLRDKMGMSYLFVSHDLNVVRLICDRIIVMYLGRIVETASTRDLFASPKHPYTRALLSSIPNPRRHGNRPLRLEGATISPIDPDPAMCRLYGRCPFSLDRCASEYPALRELGHGHLVSCHAANGIADLGTDAQRHSPAKAPE